MDVTSLPFQRAALHAAYRAGVSPATVMAEALRRLETAHDPGIFLDVTPPEAIAAAISALPGFDPVAYPLWGLPVAVKDNIAVAARPMTAADALNYWAASRSACWIDGSDSAAAKCSTTAAAKAIDRRGGGVGSVAAYMIGLQGYAKPAPLAPAPRDGGAGVQQVEPAPTSARP